MTTAKTSNPTTVPGISKPPADVSPALRKYLESLSEAIEIRLGRRGDPRDRAITLRELIDSGLATELTGRPFNPNGGGGPTFQPPYDGTVPPTPTGFTANGGYAIVTLFWDYPKYGPHAHTEIWRNSANVIGDAQLVGISSGLSFVDPVGEGASFYYWIRHVSTSEVYSQFNSANGTLAQTALNVTLLLQTLNGAITESQLTQALGSRINLIDADASTVNSVAYRVQQEALARAQAVTNEANARATAISNEAAARAASISAAVDTLQAQINDLSAIAEYDNATSYVTGELVTYNGFLYRAKSATTGNLPTNTTYWELLGEYSSLADIVDQNAASIVQINTIDATSTSAASQAIQAVTATVNNPTTGLSATASALSSLSATVNNGTTGLSATVNRVSALETTVNNPSTGVSATAAALDLVEATVNNGTTGVVATANRVGVLETTVNSPTTGLAATRATLINDYYTKTATDSAIASSSTLLTAQINVKNRTFRQASQPPSSGLVVGDLWYDSDDSNKSYRWDGSSWVATDDTRIAGTIANLANNYYTIAGTDSAIAAASLSLQSQINNTNSNLTNNYYTKSATDSAIATATLNLVTNTSLTNTLGSYVTNSTLTNNYYTASQTNSAISSATSNLVSNTSLTNTLGSYVTNSTLTTNYYTKTDTDSAISVATQSLVSTTALNNALDSYVTNSTLTNNYYTKTSTDSAISAATQNLVSTTALNNALGNYVTSSTLTNNYYTKTSVDSAISSASTTLQTSINNNTSAIQTQATTIDGLSAQYTVKVDVNGYVAGFGLASTPRDGTPFSEFTVRADRFTVASPTPPVGSRVITPFVVQATTQVINGITVPAGVYMDAAYIKNGTITNVKIGNGEIDNAKIANLSADKINAGSLDAARITIDTTVLDTYFDAGTGKHRLYIPNARIDNAQIKDLAVDTLKIAGNSITIPLSFSAGDVYVNQVISLSSGGTSCDYVYVGTNQGEYVVTYVDPWTGEIYYDYVGFPNGDFNYVCTTTSPTFSSSITVLETSWITVGDITDGGSMIVFYATMDAGTTQDAGQHIYMLVDKNDGNGYQIVANTVAGTRTASGDTYASIPMAVSTTVTGLSMMKVKILTGTRRVDLPPGTFSSPSTLRNISLSILGARR